MHIYIYIYIHIFICKPVAKFEIIRTSKDRHFNPSGRIKQTPLQLLQLSGDECGVFFFSESQIDGKVVEWRVLPGAKFIWTDPPAEGPRRIP